MDEGYCATALKYVECNPVRASISAVPWQYPWSSAHAHVMGDPHPVLAPLPTDFPIATGADWGAWLLGEDDDAALALLRANTDTGWLTGSPAFLAQLEAQLGRRLVRQPAGRKAKDAGNT
jgi:putative transposase